MEACAFVNFLNQTGVETITASYEQTDTAMWQCTLNRGVGMTPIVASAPRKNAAYTEACQKLRDALQPASAPRQHFFFSDEESDGSPSPIVHTPTPQDVVTWLPSSVTPLQFTPLLTDNMYEHTQNIFKCGVMYGCMITASKETKCEFLASNLAEEMSARNLMDACDTMTTEDEDEDAVV